MIYRHKIFLFFVLIKTIFANDIEEKIFAFQDSLDQYILWAKSSTIQAKSDKLENTLFSGWDANPLLKSLCYSYLITNEKKYLEDLVFFYKDFVSYRGDFIKTKNYEGIIKPQWNRLSNFNIFHVSPYFDYSSQSTAEVMKKRNWVSLYFSDVNYDGLFLEPLLYFLKIIKEKKLSDFDHIFKEIIERSIETVKSHESEWVQSEKEEGYYIFPKNCPFYIDGVEMPVNEAAIFGSALVLLYELTNDPFYLKRAKHMANHWLRYTKYENESVTYPYVIGKWNKGWKEEENISINSPFSPSNKSIETFHKAALTISFFLKLKNHYCTDEINNFLKELKKCFLISFSKNYQHISFFPEYLDFKGPKDSYNAHSPIFFDGWIELLKEDKEIWNILYLLSYSEMKERGYASVQPYLSVLVNKENNKENPIINKKCVSISPYLLSQDVQDSDGKCLFKAEKDSVVHIYFKHLTPKNNTLFLSQKGCEEKKIRLSINKKGVFEGKAYLKKSDCVNWVWNSRGDENGKPKNEEENKLDLEVLSLESKESSG